MPDTPCDVRSIRSRLGLTQADFAEQFGLSVSTVRDWEQGRRNPDGPARVLLSVIDQQPDVVRKATSRLSDADQLAPPYLDIDAPQHSGTAERRISISPTAHEEDIDRVAIVTRTLCAQYNIQFASGNDDVLHKMQMYMKIGLERIRELALGELGHEAKRSKRRGAPRKIPNMSNEFFYPLLLAKIRSDFAGLEYHSDREVIKMLMDAGSIPRTTTLDSYMQSISRGRKKLMADPEWKSAADVLRKNP